LDCVGLVGLAAGLPPGSLPRDYSLRSLVPDEAFGASFGGRVQALPASEAGEGDVLLVRAGVGQHHFLILTDVGFIHADARLGRVVETPEVPEWPALAAWRVREPD
jgi:hypothetical protein